ncbi:DUF1127 domain-containing protein [Sneathiella glossodoripedis]|uniref:DUF1127 domain-containing protein n=1 Tax=Sneathiella glossodoripedis TaxID=418853 RepID=UPI000471ACF1|nr:hypothetical protein [Sneathiella glossodoripedis]
MSLNTLNAKHTECSPVTPASPKAGFVTAITNTILTWQERANMRHNLAQLDQENLNDMGIDHRFVQSEIKKPFWQS